MQYTRPDNFGSSRSSRHQAIGLALVAGLWCGAMSCGEDPVEELCSNAQTHFFCGASIEEGQFDQAVEGCLGVHDDAKGTSDVCAKAHLAFLECIDTESDCNTIDSWRQDKCGVDPETICAEEAAAFCDACPGLWFAPE